MNLLENLQLMKETSDTQHKNLINTMLDFENVNPEASVGIFWYDFINKNYNEGDIMNLFENLQLMHENEIKTETPREFFKKVSNARETLKQFPKEKIVFVEKAYEEILADIGDAFNSERGDNTSQIKNEYISIAVEDGLMTAEEFETIYNALLVIGTFESHKYA